MKWSFFLLFMAASAAPFQFSAVAAEHLVPRTLVGDGSLAVPSLSLRPPLLLATGSLTVVPPRPSLGEFGEYLFYEPPTRAIAFVYHFQLAGNPINRPFLSEVSP